MTRTRGVALIIVLWLMAALTLLMYAFLGEMQVEYALAGGYSTEQQAEQLAWSGIDLGSVDVMNLTQPWHQLSDTWADDAGRYFEAPLGSGAVTLMRPNYDEPERPLWGIEDEASKININVAPREVLLRLPRVTEEIADSIIDWRDEDSEPGASGAEDSYYQALNPPYRCRNAPFQTVEELMLVRGMTLEILYGEDANLNGRLDVAENDGDENPPEDNRDNLLDAGLYHFVTAWSVDRNVNANGDKRTNINTADDGALREAGLEGGEVTGVMARRVTGGPFPTLAHLLDVLSKERFKAVVDNFTMVDDDTIPGQVNINTAPKAVLRVLPGVTADLAERLVQARSVEGATLSSIGWVADVASNEEFRQFANYITVRSNQFRLHVVGRVGTPYDPVGLGMAEAERERPGVFRRMTAVFDTLAEPRPRIVYWKDLSPLGMPYDPAGGP